MATKAQSQSKAVDAFTKIRGQLISSNTDPTQYKPYNPHIGFDLDDQKIFVEMQVPTECVISDTVEGSGKKKCRIVVLTVEGVSVMLKMVATTMMATQVNYGRD